MSTSFYASRRELWRTPRRAVGISEITIKTIKIIK
jgi:hypothetical protein